MQVFEEVVPLEVHFPIPSGSKEIYVYLPTFP